MRSACLADTISVGYPGVRNDSIVGAVADAARGAGIDPTTAITPTTAIDVSRAMRFMCAP
jgi:hypothetical protein